MFNRLFAAKESRAVQDPAWGAWGRMEDIGSTHGNTFAGVNVTPDASLEAAPVLGCRTLISDIMATMDVRQVNRKTGVDVEKMVTWLDEPDRASDWPTWMYDTTMEWTGSGELFIAPLRLGGRVKYIAAVDAARVHVQRTRDGGVSYSIDGQPFGGELVHRIKWRRNRSDLRGTPVVEMARECVGSAMAAQRFGGAFFGSGAVPPLVLEMAGNPTGDQLREIRDSWKRHNSGPKNAHTPGVLVNGTAKQLMVSPEQAQFLQTRRFAAAEIATNLFHLPADCVGVGVDGSSVTYQNLQSRWADIIRSGVMPWMTRYTHLLRQFLPAGDTIVFDPSAYQQADQFTQYQTLEIGVRNNIISVEEARAQLSMVGDPPPAEITPPAVVTPVVQTPPVLEPSE